MNQEHNGMHMDHQGVEKQHYLRLLIMAVLSFISMYILMYAMVNSLGNVFSNLNEFYMAGLMTAPMVIIELLLMGSLMYSNRRLNAIILFISATAMIVFLLLVRQQGAIGDRQFLRSMIPHHASAILMCTKASIQDPEIRDLCAQIVAGQQAEIDEMKAILDRMK